MMRLLLSVSIVAALSLASATALAGRQGPAGDWESAAPTQGADGWQAGRDRDPADNRKRARMTPEERRRLREDVTDANRRIYPSGKAAAGKPGRGGDGER